MSHLLAQANALRLPLADESVDAIVTDPPYGMRWNTDSTRFSGGFHGHRRPGGEGRNDWGSILNDDQPFDPSPWLKFRAVILWGTNHYASHLPVGTTLVWIKRNDDAFGTFLSDAEIGWMNRGHGTYCFKDLSMNSTATTRIHPTQKPIALMRWCIQKLKLKPNSLILDPYCGSGSTLIAALQEGHRVIGMDLDRHYLEVARRRIERPHQRVQRAGRAEHHPLFRDDD
jgi:site-specific DNA-methyltransferase (adenine-specific)